MAFDPNSTPYGGADFGAYQAPSKFTAGANFGAGANGIPDNQQQAPGTPTVAQRAPGSPTPPRINASVPKQRLGFSQGGAIPDDSTDDNYDGAPDSPLGDDTGDQITAALNTVKDALDYGRRLHGLTGDAGQQEGAQDDAQYDQQEASAMPTTPGTQSESGIRTRPGPGTLPPTSNPFGKRADAGDSDSGGAQQVASALPTVPASQSESGIRTRPGPGTLPPTSNPFGKRADAGDSGSGIPTDEEDDVYGTG